MRLHAIVLVFAVLSVARASPVADKGKGEGKGKSEGGVTVAIDGSHLHAHTWPEFASFNIDVSLFHSTTDFGNER